MAEFFFRSVEIQVANENVLHAIASRVRISLSVGGFGERRSSPRRGRSCGQSNEEASIAGLSGAGARFSAAVRPAHVGQAPRLPGSENSGFARCRDIFESGNGHRGVNSLPTSSIRRHSQTAWRGNVGRASCHSRDNAGAAREVLVSGRYRRPRCCGRRNREREIPVEMPEPLGNPTSDLPRT